MTTLVYLEAALNADGAAQIQESNKEVLNYALQVVDTLVQDEHEFTEGHLGQFIVHEDIEETYDSIQNPSGDVVIESIDMFSHVISDETTSIEEKKDLIQCGALAISVEADPMTILTEGVDTVAKSMVSSIVSASPSGFDKTLVPAIGAANSPVYNMDGGKALHDTLSKLVELGHAPAASDSSKLDTYLSTIKSTLSDMPSWLSSAMDSTVSKAQELFKDTAESETSAIVIAGTISVLITLALIGIVDHLWKNGGKKAATALLAKLRKVVMKLRKKK